MDLLKNIIPNIVLTFLLKIMDLKIKLNLFLFMLYFAFILKSVEIISKFRIFSYSFMRDALCFLMMFIRELSLFS